MCVCSSVVVKGCQILLWVSHGFRLEVVRERHGFQFALLGSTGLCSYPCPASLSNCQSIETLGSTLGTKATVCIDFSNTSIIVWGLTPVPNPWSYITSVVLLLCSNLDWFISFVISCLSLSLFFLSGNSIHWRLTSWIGPSFFLWVLS